MSKLMIGIKRKSVDSDFDMVDEAPEKRPKVCSTFPPLEVSQVAFAVRAQALGYPKANRPRPAQVLSDKPPFVCSISHL
jgi:hypothetical protein